MSPCSRMRQPKTCAHLARLHFLACAVCFAFPLHTKRGICVRSNQNFPRFPFLRMLSNGSAMHLTPAVMDSQVLGTVRARVSAVTLPHNSPVLRSREAEEATLRSACELVREATTTGVKRPRALGMRNARGYTLAHMFVLKHEQESLQALLRFATPSFVDVQDAEGVSALHLACRVGDLSAVEALLYAGADVSMCALENVTPLHIAARAGHANIVKLLCHAHARVDARNDFGWTPLHMAAMNGHLDVCETLVDNRADVDATNVYKRSAAIIAAANGRSEVVQMLLERGANPALRDTTDMTYDMWAAAFAAADPADGSIGPSGLLPPSKSAVPRAQSLRTS
ncbi:MAG: ankyrin repeat domain-containing protein [Methanosarcinales archaeon]|nr:MAG: ankyrin repeat domain-containing protein [Methanosarcinales archaeon]